MRRRYSPSALQKAVEMVKGETLSLNKAAKTYGIPLTTLHDRDHGKYSEGKSGARPVLTEKEEQRICDWAIDMSKIGYGRTRHVNLIYYKK